MSGPPPFKARVQASSEVAGRGTVVIVAVESGAVKVGDTIQVPERPGVGGEVTGVEVFAADPEATTDPVLQLGLLLEGIGKADLVPGSGLELKPTPGAPER